MSEFDKSIKQAKSQHFRFQLVAIVMLCFMALLLAVWLFFAKGYTLVVKPLDARASANFTVDKGLGFVWQQNLYSLSENISFTARSNGYINQSQHLDVNSAKEIVLTLVPKPGRLIVTTAPQVAEAAWYINDQLLLIGQQLTTELPPGQYKLTLDSPYHQVIKESFELTKDQQKNWQLPLTPIEGQFSLNSMPHGAKVLINDQPVGNTPLVLTRPGGDYRVHINKPGYQVISENIKLTNQQPAAQRNYQLAAQNAYLAISLKPSGGLLLLDGKSIDASARIALSSDRAHSFSYQKPGYFTHSQKIKLDPGQEQALNISLKQALGKVVLQASPVAEVFVNGLSQGNSPLESMLPAFAHKVTFKRQGYRTIEKSIVPSAKGVTSVKVNLLTEYEARRKERKSTMAQQIGIDMAHFTPRKITLGSKANQQGRRRNEFISKVEFSRAIAVSRHEISEAQYGQFKSAHTKSNLPVSNVSWIEAVQFCNWLSEQDGLPVFYRFSGARYVGVDVNSTGYRLPTEAEWEWLARKTKRALETIYVWGNEQKIPKQAGNFADESLKSTRTFYLKQYDDGYSGKSPIGSFKADRAGLYDLAGNVSEWVHDNYTNAAPDLTKVRRDPLGASRGVGHAYKGGNYQSGRLTELRGAYREPATDKAVTLGFRIARYRN